MQRWEGRVAMVTGASSGIGAAVAQQLVDNGMAVVALAKRVENIEKAVSKARLEAKSSGKPQPIATPGKLYSRECDVTKEEDILAAFTSVQENLKGVDVLVNSAGVGGQIPLTETDTAEWRRLLEVNVLGLSLCTREAVKSMRERGVDDGHVVHIGSVLGHIPPPMSMISSVSVAFYSCTKHAVRALSEGLRKDLIASKSKIRVSCVSPGLVKTEIFDSLSRLDSDTLWTRPHLYPGDIADAVLYCLAAPSHVQVNEILVRPVGTEM